MKRADIDRLESALDHLIAGLQDLKAVMASLEADDDREAALPPPVAPRPDRRSPEGLLTTREAAKVLGCHRETVYSLLTRGELAGFKVGAEWRIDAASIPSPERAKPFETPPPGVRVPRRAKYGDDTLVGRMRKREREAREAARDQQEGRHQS